MNRLLLVVAVLLHAGCALQSPQYKALPTAALGELAGTRIVLNVPQKELYALIVPANVTVATGGGLLPALIDAGINTARQNEARQTISPLLAAINEFSFRDNALQALRQHRSGLSWVSSDDAAMSSPDDAEISRELGKPNTPATLVLTVGYFLSADYGALQVSGQANLFPHVAGLRKLHSQLYAGSPQVEGAAPNSANVRNSLYRNFYSYRKVLGAGSPTELVRVWTEGGGAKAREALREGAEAVIKMMIADLQQGSVDPVNQKIGPPISAIEVFGKPLKVTRTATGSLVASREVTIAPPTIASADTVSANTPAQPAVPPSEGMSVMPSAGGSDSAVSGVRESPPQASIQGASMTKPPAASPPAPPAMPLASPSGNLTSKSAMPVVSPTPSDTQTATQSGAVPTLQPAILAQASPVGDPALELPFWDAIKNSTDPSEYRAYLEKYPNGTFAPLARARIRALEGTGSSAPAMQPSIPAPSVQSAPKPAASAAVPPGSPRPGDSWVYIYEDRKFRRGDRSRKIAITVDESTEKGIVDTAQTFAESTRRRTFPLQGAVGVVREQWIDVAPYVLSYLKADANTVAALTPELLDNPPNFISDQPTFAITSARFGGMESVTVPAGVFEAVRIDYWGTYDDQNNAAIARTPPGRITMRVWYSPRVKRAVRMEAVGIRGTYDLLVELESFRVR